MAVSRSFTRTSQQDLEREAEEVLALWEEAGSKGLDTWLELPAAYVMPEDWGGELERGYDDSPLVEECFTTLEAEEDDHDEFPTWLERLLRRIKDVREDT